MQKSPEPFAEGVHIPVDAGHLHGDLLLPAAAPAVVVFAHGSGSSRFSPRNRAVARVLNEGGLGTLLIDLLTEEEAQIDDVTAELRLDIDLLSRRLTWAIDWMTTQPHSSRLRLGVFGASTGAAAALVCGATRSERVAAIVSRGGRPDLAGQALEAVLAPTLLIVGDKDSEVLEINRRAFAKLRGVRELQVIAGASHLFKEPGALDAVATLTRDWFHRHLAPGLS
jgi:putative phosphoribosyl transferase